jgi:hypothetical protein
MFKSRNKLFVILLAALVFFLTPTFSLAADDTAATPFVIEDIGIMSIGGKWKAVSVEAVLTALDEMIAENPVLKKQIDDSVKAVESTTTQPVDSATQAPKTPYDFTKAKDTLIQQLAANNIKIYQLAIDSNDTYYISHLIFFKEKKPISRDTLRYFDKNSQKKDKQEFVDQMRGMQEFIIHMTEGISEKNMSYLNMEALPAAPPETLTVKDLPAYGVEARVAVSVVGLISPVYVKTYVFNLDGYQTYAILFSVDSERHFWNKNFKSMITSLK